MESISNFVNLQPFNTFGVPAMAKQFISISSESSLQNLWKQGLLPEDRLVLGGGSNVLFVQDPDCLVLKIDLKGIRHIEKESGEVWVSAAGGEKWNDVVNYAVDLGFSGIENMALIPGTAGAAPVQNIGAYGTELMDVFVECRAFDTVTGQFVVLDNASCGFAYRDSIFKNSDKNKYIITQITLSLQKGGHPNLSYQALSTALKERGISTPTLREVADVVAGIRTFKLPDPSEVGNAGSFFKNPVIRKETYETLLLKYPTLPGYHQENERVKIPAGWLIEQAGWKGHRDGDCGTWKHQALVLVNHGKATGEQLLAYSERIILDVLEKFGIKLEREVNIR